MPIYEYRCDDGHTFEVLRRMADDPLEACEVCAAPVQQVFHPIAVHFKGSGFYNTDYGKRTRGSGEGAEGGAESNGSSGEGSGSSDGAAHGSGDAKSGSASDGKSSSRGDGKSSGDSGSKAAKAGSSSAGSSSD